MFLPKQKQPIFRPQLRNLGLHISYIPSVRSAPFARTTFGAIFSATTRTARSKGLEKGCSTAEKAYGRRKLMRTPLFVNGRPVPTSSTQTIDSLHRCTPSPAVISRITVRDLVVSDPARSVAGRMRRFIRLLAVRQRSTMGSKTVCLEERLPLQTRARARRRISLRSHHRSAWLLQRCRGNGFD